MLWLIRFIAATSIALSTTAASAQPYPTRPIRLIVAFPPGGATDVIARTIGTPLSARIGQTVVVDNRPGSNGNLAAELAARSRPDGYTLMVGSDSLFGINPHLYAKMPVDPIKDFVPVANLVANQVVLAVNPSLVPVNDLREFVAFARASSKPLFYASIGNGSQHHLAMEMLKQQTGISLTHVPYKGGGPAAIAVVSGEVSAMFGGGSVVPLIKSGKLRAIAASGRQRCVAARAADHRRNFPRFRGDDLASFVRACWHAGGDRGQVAHRGECGAGAAGCCGAADRVRIRRALNHGACGLHRDDPQRLREVRQGDQGDRIEGG